MIEFEVSWMPLLPFSGYKSSSSLYVARKKKPMFCCQVLTKWGFPGCSAVKNLPAM